MTVGSTNSHGPLIRRVSFANLSVTGKTYHPNSKSLQRRRSNSVIPTPTAYPAPGKRELPRRAKVLSSHKRERSSSCSSATPQLDIEKIELQKQDSFISPLSLLSPLLSARRPQLLSDECEIELDVKKLTMLSGKEADDLDKSAARHIKINWKETDLEELSAKVIDDIGIRLCKGEIQTQARNQNRVAIEEWVASDTPRAKELIALLQKNGALLQPIHVRLKELRKILAAFLLMKGKKSEFTDKLYQLLNKLIKVESFSLEKEGLLTGKDLGKFLNKIDQLGKRESLQEKTVENIAKRTLFRKKNNLNEKIRKEILPAFGDNQEVQEQVLGTLKKWNDADELFNCLKEKVSKWSLDTIRANNVPYIEHQWEEDVDYLQKEGQPPPIDQISISEIWRCYIMATMKKITINGKSFCEPVKSSSKDPDREKCVQLFRALYHGGLEKKNGKGKELSLEKQVDLLFLKKKGDPDVSSKDERIANKTRLCLRVLKTGTMSCWNRADALLRKRFPKLFQSPYYCKLIQGIENHIVLSDDDPGSFEVTLKKNYVVYPRVNPEEEKDFPIVDKNYPLATIPILWTVHSPYDNKWKAVLRIGKEWKIDAPKEGVFWKVLKKSQDEIEKDITNALVNYAEFDALTPARINSRYRRSLRINEK